MCEWGWVCLRENNPEVPCVMNLAREKKNVQSALGFRFRGK